MSKWDKYRHEREIAIDTYVNMFFKMKKAMILISLIKIDNVVTKFCEKFKEW